jgi:hypothetical protein
MAKKRDKATGYGKLLDAWTPPHDAGDPIGCLATTFTFTAAFFEEECLGRFLQLETDATEDGPAYLVEREEKLSQVQCAAALVDQHHCRGSRNLRWDLLAVRPQSGIMHAKISLLRWSNLIRLIVASANLTEDAYRRNREVFGVIDYERNGEAPVACMREVATFLREVVDLSEPATDHASPARQRCQDFLDGTLSVVSRWAIGESNDRRRTIRVLPVLVSPGRPSAMDSLAGVWPSGKPQDAFVVSPFFDPPEAENRPAKALWQLLKQRGPASANFLVTAEEVPDTEALFIHAPESLRQAMPTGRSSVNTDFHRLPSEPDRPLHAKAIWLQGDAGVAYMMGSSNFTTAGLGLGERPNLEANLVYLTNGDDGIRAIQGTFPDGQPIDPNRELRWQPRQDAIEDSPDSDTPVLPQQFTSATYCRGPSGQMCIRLAFTGNPPAGWRLCTDDDAQVFYTEEKWQADDRRPVITMPWTDDLPPYGFLVRWVGVEGAAWWPVNISDADTLPHPQELRDLPLEILIDILTSARPVHHVIRAWLARKGNGNGTGKGSPTVIDPLMRVNTSSFLLQRTRRVSWALSALRERMERPVATEQSLDWRFYGPIGVQALAKAIAKEAKSADEKAFLLAELALELSRVRPKEQQGALPAGKVKAEIAKAIEGIRAEATVASSEGVGNLRGYIQSVFQRVET